MLTHAHCLYLIDVEREVLFKMAVICQVLIIQSQKYKHIGRKQSRHAQAALCEVAPHLKVNPPARGQNSLKINKRTQKNSQMYLRISI